ncbi:hypothetical protein LOTGIDRAFT_237394 [Lottia gigantea]|uniref:Uncharacterized protein n=1 Tax=Lottia gigantea TaxID=225164 RepID=V4CPN3_LOTGI|nr:hypothetical protein LOTGIDRAFT_237394 [Lottia gigantea]ESP04360.1 hypothetical protein LOTGIDRAFT_237394 [Lottia gigantea]
MEMELQKVIIVAIMAVSLFSQVILAAPLLSSNEEEERLPNAIDRIVSSLQNEEPLTRNRRYVVIQVMGKIARNERQYRARHPGVARMHHRHRRPQTIVVKKQ